ncbi:Cytochrome P450 82C4 [Morus notabilis]|uniref:Cytochrome P450 82C4 n=1 Tax=Morus notabilis TaxID=981085 RepID=W9R307_9ROSA|nr:cytochrome P450 82C4 [Morus notabilis]EXB37248.1 Cytochrome P450 82C4 [Morus notabilis]
MDPLLQILSTIICCLLPLLISFIYRLQRRASTTSTRTNCPVPQVCGAWPVIGHLHLLGGHQLLHKTLGAMADKHGPVFTIKLGSHKVLVVNSWETARECFTVHDKTFSTRPNIAASKLLGYDYAMFGFAPYGPYWC